MQIVKISILAIMIVILSILCIAYKISTLGMLLLLKDLGHVPDKKEIKAYTKRAAIQLFHNPI